MNSLFRRGGTVLAAAAVAVATLSAPGPAQAATYDASPGTPARTWSTGQLTGGLVHNPSTAGSTTTASPSTPPSDCDGLGGHAATVTQISDAIASDIDSYTTNVDYGTADVYAGAVAKATVLAQAAGADPASYGGVDLVGRLEGRTSTDPVTLGRIEDYVDPANQYGGDYANVIGQSFAAEGLAAAGSPRSADATAYLLEQQCSEGYFRLDFTKDKTAVDQSCDGGKAAGDSPADTDVTALAVLALEAQSADPAVSTAIGNAETLAAGPAGDERSLRRWHRHRGGEQQQHRARRLGARHSRRHDRGVARRRVGA